MKITKFRDIVCYLEKGKKEIDVAQVSEILKVANTLLDGKLYKEIKTLNEEELTKRKLCCQE